MARGLKYGAMLIPVIAIWAAVHLTVLAASPTQSEPTIPVRYTDVRQPLLRNDGGNKQNWIKIKLIGSNCNRTAIGARVRAVAGSHSQIDEVRSGSSVMSQSDLRWHFGLGKAQIVDLIEVKWPTTQKTERFTQVKANQILTIREAMGTVPPAAAQTKTFK